MCHYNTCNSARNLVFVHVKIRQNLVRRGYMYIEYIFNRTILIVHVHVFLHKYKKQIMNFILWKETCDQKNRQSNIVNKLLAIDMAQCYVSFFYLVCWIKAVEMIYHISYINIYISISESKKILLFKKRILD